MGSSQSVRATHFQHPSKDAALDDEDFGDENRISISNKMASLFYFLRSFLEPIAVAFYMGGLG